MTETIRIELEGVNPSTVHIHLTTDNTAVLTALTHLETLMSNLGDSVAANTAAQTAAFARIDEDVAHLRDLVAQAIAVDAANAAEVARLTAEADAAVAQITANTAALNAEDPDPAFPVVEPPAG